MRFAFEWMYKKLHQFSANKVKELHLKKYGADIKCPNCNQWFSISGIGNKHEHVSKPEFGYHVKCGACNHESYWNAVAAPVLLLCDEKGTPL